MKKKTDGRTGNYILYFYNKAETKNDYITLVKKDFQFNNEYYSEQDLNYIVNYINNHNKFVVKKYNSKYKRDDLQFNLEDKENELLRLINSPSNEKNNYQDENDELDLKKIKDTSFELYDNLDQITSTMNSFNNNYMSEIKELNRIMKKL